MDGRQEPGSSMPTAQQHRLAHNLRGPIRAIAIYTDMLSTSLASSNSTVNPDRCVQGILDAVVSLDEQLDEFMTAQAD